MFEGGPRAIAGMILLISFVAAAPGPAVGTSDACASLVPQDDAGSGRDAGDTRNHATSLFEEDSYEATLVAPNEGGADTEDWFEATVPDDGPRRVMVEVSTYAEGLGYLAPQDPASTIMTLEAYAPGAMEPTHVGEADQGAITLDFTTGEAGTWLFRVSLEIERPGLGCPAAGAPTDEALNAYMIYWGCHPHCVDTAA